MNMSISPKIMTAQSDISFDMKVSNNLEQKIRHLCDVFKTKEWSGILFYRKTGTVGTKDFKVEALDMCLMDIGSGDYTEFDDSKDVVSYRVEHEELLSSDVYEGLIHSHNQMAAFFSGTDLSTLTKEGGRTNHFLSLIVNNDGKYCARITRMVNSTIESVITTDSKITSDWYTFGNFHFLGKPVNSVNKETVTKDSKVIEYFDASITVPKIKIKKNTIKELDERIDELKSRVVEMPVKPLWDRQLEFDFPKYDSPDFSDDIIKTMACNLICILGTGNILQYNSWQRHFTNPELKAKMALTDMSRTYEMVFGDLNSSDAINHAYYFMDSLINCVFENAEFLLESPCDITGYQSEIVDYAKEFVQKHMQESPIRNILISILEDFTICI